MIPRRGANPLSWPVAKWSDAGGKRICGQQLHDKPEILAFHEDGHGCAEFVARLNSTGPKSDAGSSRLATARRCRRIESGDWAWTRRLPNVAKLWASVVLDLKRDWTLAELAHRSHCSPEHLWRLCMRELGRSPMQHLTCLRMERARQLLEGGDDKLETGAASVGYANAAIFSRVFKRWVGVAPGEYRGRGKSPAFANRDDEWAGMDPHRRADSGQLRRDNG